MLMGLLWWQAMKDSNLQSFALAVSSGIKPKSSPMLQKPEGENVSGYTNRPHYSFFNAHILPAIYVESRTKNRINMSKGTTQMDDKLYKDLKKTWQQLNESPLRRLGGIRKGLKRQMKTTQVEPTQSDYWMNGFNDFGETGQKENYKPPANEKDKMEYDRGWLDHLHELEQNNVVIPEAFKPPTKINQDIELAKNFHPSTQQQTEYANGTADEWTKIWYDGYKKALKSGEIYKDDQVPTDPVLKIIFDNGVNVGQAEHKKEIRPEAY